MDFEKDVVLIAVAGFAGWDREIAIRVDEHRRDSLIAIAHVRSGVPALCGPDSFRAPGAARKALPPLIKGADAIHGAPRLKAENVPMILTSTMAG